MSQDEQLVMNENFKHLWLWEGKWEARPGEHIKGCLMEAKAVAAETGRPLTFKQNSVTLTVAHDSDLALLYRDWERALDGSISKEVGPYPKP